ncbi:hypothetical protein N9545_03810 [Salibacteraceae bacterium]|mgnify:CR=1 FL=1|jgi:hypothetical protein|nr:hypothetical protein [Salibacteraceae bacterium]MDB9709946.1 hypothetical protein [Salibacteraceae bacterium]MDC1304162.1 hypothetical protein [Salibacteraceae bacterium]
MSELEKVITEGGDERIELKENGLNKYFVDPRTSKGHLNRGSCTCSALSVDVRTKVSTVYNRLITNEVSVEDIRIKQRFRIKALLQDSYTDDFNIFFAPSGSDLCYFPLMFSQIKNPNKPILSLITCPEELGTGSILANTGKFFSDKTQIEKSVNKGAPLKADLHVDSILFPARNEDGSIIDHKQAIYDAIDEHRDTHQIIVNLVIGSKSGIEDNISIITDGPADVTWVVDLCQMRATPKLFNELLAKNCLLMITGSKFYQSPPFCGALLVPERYAKEIEHGDIDSSLVEGFDKIYSKFDIPPSYKGLRTKFPSFENIGFTLRWEAAICESELLANYSERDATYAISNWNKHVKEYLETKELFNIMVDQDVTNRSIISFKIAKNGQTLTNDQLKKVYEHLCLHGSKYFPKYERLSTGQPVTYESYSFLRVALGSTNIRKLIEENHDLSDDFKLIDVIEQITNELC